MVNESLIIISKTVGEEHVHPVTITSGSNNNREDSGENKKAP